MAYAVTIGFKIQEEGVTTPLFNIPEMTWNEVPYIGIVEIQALMVQLLGKTVDMGRAMPEYKAQAAEAAAASK